MRRVLIAAVACLLVASCSGGSTDAEIGSTTVAASPALSTATTQPAPTTSAVTSTTALPTTTLAPTTTVAPTGSVQSCPELRTLDDPDSDGWGECIVSMNDALQQYFFISGTFNSVVGPLNLNSRAGCTTFLAAEQAFIDEMKAAPWPAEVQPQLTELISASEFELFALDDRCRTPTQAQADAVAQRRDAAVFAWRQAIGAPTDF